MQLTDSVKALKGVGDKTAKLFQKLNIYTLRDLLHHFPREYDRFEQVSTIASIMPDRQIVIAGLIAAAKPSRTKTGKTILTLTVRDNTGQIAILYF